MGNNAVDYIKEKAIDIKNSMENIDVGKGLVQAAKLPIAKINRAEFLEKELKLLYPEDIVQLAIDKSPAYAGIPKAAINELAKKSINYETLKVSTISFAAGIPGGLAMLGTIPADLTQYFIFSLRVMQKLAYLFSFQEFDLNDDQINDETMNSMLIFLGVMFGVQEANTGLKILAKAAAARAVKQIERVGLMKIPAYVALKKIALNLGLKMNRQILQKAVSGVIPILGGVLMGGVSYGSFKISANRLRKQFLELPISDPDFYKDPASIDSYIQTDE